MPKLKDYTELLQDPDFLASISQIVAGISGAGSVGQGIGQARQSRRELDLEKEKLATQRKLREDQLALETETLKHQQNQLSETVEQRRLQREAMETQRVQQRYAQDVDDMRTLIKESKNLTPERVEKIVVNKAKLRGYDENMTKSFLEEAQTSFSAFANQKKQPKYIGPKGEISPFLPEGAGADWTNATEMDDSLIREEAKRRADTVKVPENKETGLAKKVEDMEKLKGRKLTPEELDRAMGLARQEPDPSLLSARDQNLKIAREREEDRMRQDYVREMKNFHAVERSTAMANAAARAIDANPKAATSSNDHIIVMMYQKLQDPESVVRESEFNRVKLLPNLQQRLNQAFSQLTKGNMLDKGLRKHMVDAINMVYGEVAPNYERIRKHYSLKAEKRGYDASNIIPDALSAIVTSQGLPKPIVQQNQKTKEFRFSLDGGKTWKDGLPTTEAKNGGK